NGQTTAEPGQTEQQKKRKKDKQAEEKRGIKTLTQEEKRKEERNNTTQQHKTHQQHRTKQKQKNNKKKKKQQHKNKNNQQEKEKSQIQKTVKVLEQTFKSFGVNARITKAHVGPAVTKYEVYPEQGVKVSRILNLQDDLALALAAQDIRIEAPIPGKSAVGIEV